MTIEITPKVGLEVADYETPRIDLIHNRNWQKIDDLACSCPGLVAVLSAVEPVDVFVYDTTMDTDGGAWRYNCEHTSWENETLNTVTRGATRRFPALVGIVAEADKVTLFDLTDPSAPMWRVFLRNSATLTNNLGWWRNNTVFFPTAINMINGVMCFGLGILSNNAGVCIADFPSDKGSRISNETSNHNEWSHLVDVYNKEANVLIGTKAIVNSSVNDVAMTILPDVASELVTNGDFDTDTGWILEATWTISAGVLSIDGLQTATTHAYQVMPNLVNGKTYIITVDVLAASVGLLRIIFGSLSEDITTSGVYTYEAVATASTTLFLQARDFLVSSVNSISVKEKEVSRIDPVTGLDIPCIAVATDGGVSVIDGPAGIGTVVDVHHDTLTNSLSTSVAFGKLNSLIINLGTLSVLPIRVWNSIPISDVENTPSVWLKGNEDAFYYIHDLAVVEADLFLNADANSTEIKGLDGFFQSTRGLTLLDEYPETPANGMVNYITKDYQSGWMQGDIKGAWLADTVEGVLGVEELLNNDFSNGLIDWFDITGGIFNESGGIVTCSGGTGLLRQTTATIGKTYKVLINVTAVTSGSISTPYDGVEANRIDLTTVGLHEFTYTQTTDFVYIYSLAFVGSFDFVSMIEVVVDRSVNQNPLTVIGSNITRTAVADGAELVEYGGFAGTDYLHQGAGLEIAAGDFYVKGNLIYNDGGTLVMFRRPDDTDDYFQLYLSGHTIIFTIGTAGQTATSEVLTVGERYQFVAMRKDSKISVSINAVPGIEVASTKSITPVGQELFIGTSVALTSSTTSKLTLLKIGLGTPSDEQITKIYEDESKLFTPDALCTLQGSSNDVKALAIDDKTGELYAGTRSGATVFNGLLASQESVCIRNAGGSIVCDTDSDYTSISAQREMVVHGMVTGATVNADSVNIKESLIVIDAKKANVIDVYTKTVVDGFLALKRNLTNLIFGDEPGGNYSEFESDGTLNAIGDARTWDDLQVVLTGAELHPTQSPIWIDYKGSRALQFSSGSAQSIYFIVQIPHTWDEGTDLRLHLHAIHQATATGSVIWDFTHSWANVNEAFPTETTIQTTFASHADVDIHAVGQLGVLVGTGKKISSIILCSLTRRGDIDTSSEDSVLIGADFHHLINTLGSRQEYIK